MRQPRYWLSACALAALLASPFGCGDGGGSRICDTWCDMAIDLELKEIDASGCELTDDLGEFESGCVDVCEEITDAVVRYDIKECVECVHGEVGSAPSWDEVQGALAGPCEPECFNDAMTDFWDDFWDEWVYQDYDYECD